MTQTEIEVYDTTQPADPATGLPPVKARARQRSNNKGTAKATETGERHEDTDIKSETTSNGKTLDEAEVTATKPPSLWERAKVAFQIPGAIMILGAIMTLGAIMILAAAGWTVYKIKKR